MTKEPIMIDDVDVSECEFYIKSKNLEFNCKQTPQSYFCKNKPNCYYKQLKRKEQECEKLLKFNNSLVKEHKTIGNDLYKEIKDYRIKLKTKEEECEKKDKDIKFLLEKLDLANNRIQDCEIYWEKEKKNLKQQLDQLKEKNEELKTCYNNNLEVLRHEEKVNNNLTDRVMKAEQALQEIKEVIKQEGYINKKTQIFKGSVLYQAMEDLKLPDRKILKIINEVLNV